MSITIENVLIVDSDRTRVMRIRSAAKLEATFSAVTTVSMFEQALERLEFTEYQLIFIAADEYDEELATFLEQVKATSGGQVASYVGLVGSNLEQHQIAKLMLKGFDSVLSEPFSIDSFHEILEITVAIVAERAVERRKRLVEIALVDAITYIDSVAGRMKSNREQRASTRARAKLQSTLLQCAEVDQELYFKVLVEKLVAVSASKRKRKVYTGASTRLRKKLNKQYADELMGSEDEEPGK